MGKIILYKYKTTTKSIEETKDNKMYKKLVSDIKRKAYDLCDMPARTQEIIDYFKIDDSKGEIPIVEILMKFGFKIFQADLEPKGLSAYIAVNPKFEDIFQSNRITCVHVNDNIGHKRFSLAHELAHYLFDFDEEKQLYYYNTYFPEKENDSFEEQRANQFAANLLMPKKVFLKKFEEYSKSNGKADTVNALGHFFLVSSTAILRRFDELDIEGYSN